MSAFGLPKRVSAIPTRGAYGQVKRQWMHGSLKRQTIMMPAMSPLTTKGTITRWKKEEGETFAAGDVLLQIESDIATIDVEAHTSGILGKILTPNGTSGIPVEQVIALARDMDGLSLIQKQGNAPTPPPSNSLSSLRTPSFSPRTPSLFEMHTMGYGYQSVQHVGGPRRAPLTPRTDTVIQEASSSYRVHVPPPHSPSPLTATVDNSEDVLIDGAAIRRMIVFNLSRPHKRESEKQENRNIKFDDLL